MLLHHAVNDAVDTEGVNDVDKWIESFELEEWALKLESEKRADIPEHAALLPYTKVEIEACPELKGKKPMRKDDDAAGSKAVPQKKTAPLKSNTISLGFGAKKVPPPPPPSTQDKDVAGGRSGKRPRTDEDGGSHHERVPSPPAHRETSISGSKKLPFSTVLNPEGKEVLETDTGLRDARLSAMVKLSILPRDRDLIAKKDSQTVVNNGYNIYKAVDLWQNYACVFSCNSETSFEDACHFVDNHLSSRTFLVGDSLSPADLAVYYTLSRSRQIWERRKSDRYQSLVRWYDWLTETVIKPTGKVRTVNPSTSTIGENSNQRVRVVSRLVDLPGAKVGEVCLRYAPQPCGFLHIGHINSVILNSYFAQRYEGRLIIRIDDCYPVGERTELIDNLLIDIETLGMKYDAVTYTSDYFPLLMEMAESLILKGKAYVDDTPSEQLQREWLNRVESKCRDHSIEKNLELWKEMIAGSDIGRKCSLRGKLYMQSPNKFFRDPEYYLCNPVPHRRTGEKYKVYPTYDFASPFVDATEGITHALRSTVMHGRSGQYYRILEDMGLRRVQICEINQLNMAYIPSKDKLWWLVENGKVDGWDDPRLPTFKGILRRGLQIEALKQFVYEKGSPRNLSLVEWDELWTINKKMIDPGCPRHTAILEQKRVLFTLTNGLDEQEKFEGAGLKATTYTKRIWLDNADASSIPLGEEITLIGWGHAIIKEIVKDKDGAVTELRGVFNREGACESSTRLKLTWLPVTDDLTSLSLVEYDHLITKKKLEKGDNFFDFLNPYTKEETLALGDSNMRNLQHGELLLLEGKGYFICDVPFVNPISPIVLIAVPDGASVDN